MPGPGAAGLRIFHDHLRMVVINLAVENPLGGVDDGFAAREHAVDGVTGVVPKGKADNIAAAEPHEVAAADASTEAKSSEWPGRAKRLGAKKTAAVSAKATKASSDRIKPDSKQDKIVALLRRPEGATLDALVKETQWQKHSVRGFLAGTVRKKLKLPLLSEKIDGVRNYRIGTAIAAKTKKTVAARKA